MKKATNKQQLTIDQVIDKLNENNITVYPYEEEGVLCGYELNTYTDGGVNEVLFLDFRTSGDPKNVDDFKKEFLECLNDKNIDEMIEMYRQADDYKKAFTVRQSLSDFTKWEKQMNKIIKSI